jgi:hypothetical protein
MNQEIDPKDKKTDEKAESSESKDTKTDEKAESLAGHRTASEKKRNPTGRKARVPLGTHRAKMVVEGFKIPPDKIGRWVVDQPGRLAQAEAGGYVFVEDPMAKVGEGPENNRDRLSTKIRMVSGTKEGGVPLHSYLMLINKDWYEEDQRTKQAEIDKTDEAIRSGNIQGKVGEDGRYIPDGGITYNP